ncbi:Protein NRT1/ PTR FAMILY 5.8 [Geodia barretti]|nr:Protein NRT1/ PTR FAMILY 5.8 [Geodia barretti]
MALEYWHPNQKLNIDMYPSVYWGVNSITILLFLPVVNFLVIPSFPKLTIRARIGIGLVLYCIGSVVVLIIHAVPLANHKQGTISNVQLGCIFIPIVIFAMAEVTTLVSVLEFIYAQSPESMKGLLTGLYYLFRGLSSTVSSALFLLYKNSIKNRELSPFYAVFTIVQVVGLVFYVAAATFHKNRLRHDDNSLQERLIIENQLHGSTVA